MTLVIGVDPGGTTGLAAVEYTDDGGYRLLAHIGYPSDPRGVVAALEAIAEEHASPAGLAGPWWIAVERFIVNRRAGRSSSAGAGERARAIVGALQAAFPGRVKERNASAMKGWNAGDRRLDAAGIKPTQGRPHTRDAAGHALFFQVTSLGNPDPLGRAFELAELERRRG